MPWYERHDGSRRWINDAPRFRFNLSGCLSAVISYKHALTFPCNDSAMAARFALWSAEASWHSGRLINAERGIWRTSDRIESSPERLERLLSATLGRTMKLADLDNNHPSVFMRWIEEKKRKTKLERAALRSTDNFCRIMGLKDGVQRFMVLRYVVLNRWFRLQWEPYTRARDMFFLGRFDINRVIDRMMPECVKGEVDPEIIATQYYIYCGHPSEIIALGIGADQYALPEYIAPWLLKHLHHYTNFWRQEQNINRMDELTRLPEGEAFDWRMRPERLLRACEEARAAMEARWAAPTRALTPEEQEQEKARAELMLRIREEDDWEFPELGYEGATYPGYELKVVRKKSELQMVADVLDNCAAGYLVDLAMGNKVFIYAMKAGTDEIVGLGNLAVDKEGKPARNCWSQIAGKGNKRVCDGLRGCYNDYLKMYV